MMNVQDAVITFFSKNDSDAERKSGSPGPSSSSSDTNGSIVLFCLVALDNICRKACVLARTNSTPWKSQLAPQFLHVSVSRMLTLDTVSGHSFCNVVVQGIFEHLCDQNHIVAWTIVRRDAPRALVCQREM